MEAGIEATAVHGIAVYVRRRVDLYYIVQYIIVHSTCYPADGIAVHFCRQVDLGGVVCKSTMEWYIIEYAVLYDIVYMHCHLLTLQPSYTVIYMY